MLEQVEDDYWLHEWSVFNDRAPAEVAYLLWGVLIWAIWHYLRGLIDADIH